MQSKISRKDKIRRSWIDLKTGKKNQSPKITSNKSGSSSKKQKDEKNKIKNIMN